MNKTRSIGEDTNTAKVLTWHFVVFIVALFVTFAPSLSSVAFADEVDSRNTDESSTQLSIASGEITVPAQVTSYQPTSLSASVTYDPSFVKGQKTRFTFNVPETGKSRLYKLDAFRIQTSSGWSSIVDTSRTDLFGFKEQNYFEEEVSTPGTYQLSFYVWEYVVDADGSKTYDPYVRFQIEFTVNESADLKSIETIVAEVVAECESACAAAGDTSDYVKALWLNDWIVDHTEYDDSLTYMSAEGVFGRGTGTCEGYHEAYTMLLNKAGIETRRVESTGDAHVWTGAKLDGNWYNIDTTWNDAQQFNGYPDAHHLYFALPTDIMQAAHKKWNATYYISLGESAPFDAVSCEDNYFVRSGELAEYLQPYLETSGTYSVSAHLAARKTEFSIAAEKAAWPDNYKEIIYRLVAHELAQRDWGSNIKVSVGYSGGSLHFYATYDGSEPLKAISNAVVRGMEDKNYSGEALYQAPQVFLDGVQLAEGQDYQLSYENNVNATSYPNQAVMTITGIGAYAGTLAKVFDINRVNLNQVSIDPIPNQVATGSALMPAITMKHGDRQLVQDQDFTVEYADNVQAGTASATLTGKGNYTGTLTVNFVIAPDPNDPGGSTDPEPTDPDPGTESGGSGTPAPAPGVDADDSASQTSAVTGGWKKKAGKWWFAYDANTQASQNKPWPADEWVTIGGKRYHFDSAGYMSARWYWSGSAWYWLGTDGAMKTGWAKVSGKWYFMDSDGIMQTGKRAIDGKVYFLTNSGAMKTGWNSELDGWYYYSASGAMVSGWVKVKGKWYYLDPSNGLMRTGFYDVAGVRYYSSDSGAMQTGWKKLDGKWYYFAGSGAMRTNAWISGKYWVDANGVMATDAWVGTDADHLYYVDGDGKWVRDAQR